MSAEQRIRMRTKPAEDSSDDEATTVNLSAPFSSSVAGEFRGRTDTYQTPAPWPTIPRYQKDEVVYLMIVGQPQPAGPYVIVSVTADGLYVIKRRDNNEQYPEYITEDRLVVPAQ
ncbi:hypothetical protein BU16DRAFT_564283 [Lophium mytilinum]|uniref:Uncharacterized protein n=1 Tax=Lophium mytilinum TaxID=390894 RepID=A0A6A6QLK8_9PEZI|nr:hypothetical protein BU16DRAFT_564283 [Lophium mytilinum]